MSNISQFLVSHGGPVLFAIVLAEQAGLPFPAVPWLLAAGALAAGGALNPALAIALAALACLVADSAWFYVGRRGGRRVLRLFCRLSLSPNSCVGGTKGLLERHGAQGLVAAKFIPVLGGVMPPLAGALGMSTTRFLAYDGLGSVLYGSLYIATGFVFHNQLRQIGAMLNELGLSVLLLSALLVPAYIAFKYLRRRKARIDRTAHENVANRPTGLMDEILSAALAGSVTSSARIPEGCRDPAVFHAPALALTSFVSQPAAEHSSPAIAQPTTCDL